MSTTAAHPRFVLARAGAVGLGGAGFSAVAGFALTLLLARGIGAEGAGLVLQVIAAATIATAFAKIGMDSASLWLLPRLLVDDPRRSRGVIVFAVLVAMAGGAFAAAVLLVVSSLDELPPALAEALSIAAPWLPAAGALAVAAAALRGLGATGSYVLWTSVVQPAARLAAVAVIIGLGAGPTVAAIAWSAVPVAILVPTLVTVHRRLRALEGDRAVLLAVPAGDERSRIWRFALPRTLSAGLEQGLLWLDVLVVGAIAGSTAAGLYGGASRFIAAGLVVDAALRLVVSPRFSELLHRGDLAGAQQLYRRTTRTLILLATPLYLLLAAFAPLALGLLGPGFPAASATLVVLCVGAIVSFCAGPIHSLLVMSGHSGLAAVNKAIVLLVNVVLDIVLVPGLGILGAGIAWSACMVLDCVLAVWQVRRVHGIRLDAASVLPPLLVAVLGAGVPAGIALMLGAGIVGAVCAAVAAAIIIALISSSARWIPTRRTTLEPS